MLQSRYNLVICYSQESYMVTCYITRVVILPPSGHGASAWVPQGSFHASQMPPDADLGGALGPLQPTRSQSTSKYMAKTIQNDHPGPSRHPPTHEKPTKNLGFQYI